MGIFILLVFVMFSIALVLATILVATDARYMLGRTITLEDFASPTHSWEEQNDPVMGGQSTGSFTIKKSVGYFEGEVKDVPFLKAPGFIKVTTTDKNSWPDVSGCDAMVLNVMSNNTYAGLRLSFSNAKAPGGKFFSSGYKSQSPISAPVGKWGNVRIPFTEFTDDWDDATGKPIKSCDPTPGGAGNVYCPSQKNLRNVETISLWGEGVDGAVQVQIKSISASGCK